MVKEGSYTLGQGKKGILDQGSRHSLTVVEEKDQNLRSPDEN